MIIKEYNDGGTIIRIHDDYMRKTPEENRILKANLDEVARRINERINREAVN